MTARALMFQGTGSDVGKSLIVAGLCRLLATRGLSVRPFKPQNMSNNAAVTEDGGEIGRAQALQARAARVAPSVDMNPVLLKPQSEVGAQIVVQGRVFGNARAREYQSRKAELMPYVLDSFARIRAQCDVVLVEGAGSASEVNLRANDIANMGFARAADVPVVLIGDIDRGGVIASLCGTAAVVDPDDAKLIAGFIVNKMRGDPSLFATGMTFVAERTGWAPLGLVPHFRDAHRLPAEDVFGLRAPPTRAPDSGGRRVRVVVPVLPHIANFDDLDPLRLEPGVELVLLRDGASLPVDTELVILPGSKATIADLAALRACGWDADIIAYARRGGRVLGLCGGYQMLGHGIADPDGIEGPPGSAAGLGLLEITTELTGDKSLVAVQGRTVADDVAVAGYEMHIGRTTGTGTQRPLLRLDDGRLDGAVSADGRVAGSYLHGFFAGDAQRAAWLVRLGAPASSLAYEALVEQTLDALAAHLDAHLDVDKLLSLAR
ncbi:cobyric acid synthase [Bradyrhizobium erythrophlei]|uniref:Cobyric acid synthase n=1 Tax=Bradyrhizobium erythrophlei TaxID=1437360 RepID=A0A1M5R024_9BRAD|nr:cobyric acid synthase [Bradyrhizobium erythrophlei]SHH19466.1 adenosylcobyric acid synthase (glutamine-hydrolysing) [Bradyrhizobium erythrophlei]